MRTMARMAVLVLTMFALVGIGQAPANAAGGGCRHGPVTSAISSCVSFDGFSYVYGDFYLNWKPNSYCNALMTIYVNGSPTKSQSYTLGALGRYGPISQHVLDTNPNQESAFTRVQVWDCNWNFKEQIDSPVVTFIA